MLHGAAVANSSCRDSLGRKYATELPAAAAGLAFIAGSLRVVAAHNNGITLWSPQESNPLETWNGPGGNASPLISPEGHLVATTLHEPGMRLWRLSDGAVMPLTGYTERVRSFAWTADGAYLLTSGAERVILWPAPEEGGRFTRCLFLSRPTGHVQCGRGASDAALYSRRLCGLGSFYWYV